MKLFSSNFPFFFLLVIVLALDLPSRIRASVNETSRALKSGGNNKKGLWRNVTFKKRDSPAAAYGEPPSSSSVSASSSSSAAAAAALLNSQSAGGESSNSFSSPSSSYSFDSYSSVGNTGKSMGSSYADYGQQQQQQQPSYGSMSEYGVPQMHMMPEPSSMKYHYKIVPQSSGMGWGDDMDDDDNDSSLKEYIGLLGLKGIKGVKGLKGLGLLSLPLLPFAPIIIPLLLALPFLPIIAAALFVLFFPIPIFTIPGGIGGGGLFNFNKPAGQPGREAPFFVQNQNQLPLIAENVESLWNSWFAKSNESQQFFSRAFNYDKLTSYFEYAKSMVKAVAQEYYFSNVHARDLKDPHSQQEHKQENLKQQQCLERMACELTQFLRNISPKSTSMITGTVKNFLGSTGNHVTRQIKLGVGVGEGGQGMKLCRERFICERLRRKEEPQLSKSKKAQA